MTRQKKSRKAAPLGPTQKPKHKKEVVVTKKRTSKHKGLSSGSRNNPETTEVKNKQPAKSNDPRHGSKTPISLTAEAPVKLAQYEPQVVLKKVKPDLPPPELELEQIENDERLNELLNRVDQGETLTGKDAKYFNAKTARHQALMEQLGFEYDDEEDDQPGAQSKSLVEQWEDDNWDDNLPTGQGKD